MLLLFSLCGFFLLYGFPSLGIISLLRLVGPLATGSSSCIPSLFLLAASSVSLSLPLVFLLAIFGRSSGHFVAFCDLFCLCSLVGSSPGGRFSSVSGFSSSCLGVPGGFPRVFFSSPVGSLSSLSGPLAMTGYPVCPLHRSFLVSFGVFSVLCLQCSFFLLSRFHGYLARPAFVSPRSLFLSPRSPFRSLSRPFLALPRGLLLYCLVFLFGSFFLFCALASGPPGVSAVMASSTVEHTASLSSVVAVASSSSSWFSPLAIVLLCCSPLGVVSLGSCGAGASCRLVLLPVLIFTP